MKTAVVITTINKPTDAVREWVRRYHDGVIVIGDEKTPSDWLCQGSFYFPTSAGLPALSNRISPNRYQRKMLGYISAAIEGADVIIDTDDDNEPLAWICLPEFAQGPRGPGFVCSVHGWVNIYAICQEPDVWPRGLPLTAIAKPCGLVTEADGEPIGVWQGLANGDSDVDAICRLAVKPMLGGEGESFKGPPFALARGTLAPINSQATLWRRECFPLLYLPCTVSMRACDILRGYVAQPILWAAGYRLGVCGPIVRQERNPHNLMDDFRQEMPLYLGMGEEVVAKVSEVVKPEASMADNLRAAYRAIIGVHGIDDELPILEEWLAAIG